MSLDTPDNASAATAPAAADLDFDPDALRDKYRHERDTRVRPDGNDQYVEVRDDFGRYIEDPYVEPGFTRAPLNDEIDVLIIGGGFGGLLAGAHLREAGVERHPDHREGWRFRRDLVLESLSRRAMRYRELHLSAAARGDRLHPKGEVFLRPGDSCARAAHRRDTSTFTDWPVSRPRYASCAGTRTRPMAGHDRSGDRIRHAMSSCRTAR